MQESVASRLEERKWLTGLAPAGIFTLWITFYRFVVEEKSRPGTGEELRTEANSGCKAVGHWCDIGNGQRVLAKLGTFTGDNEIQLKSVATVFTRTGLDVAKHVGHGCEVGIVEIMVVTESNKLSYSLFDDSEAYASVPLNTVPSSRVPVTVKAARSAASDHAFCAFISLGSLVSPQSWKTTPLLLERLRVISREGIGTALLICAVKSETNATEIRLV